jgi:hypothetical protein
MIFDMAIDDGPLSGEDIRGGRVYSGDDEIWKEFGAEE